MRWSEKRQKRRRKYCAAILMAALAAACACAAGCGRAAGSPAGSRAEGAEGGQAESAADGQPGNAAEGKTGNPAGDPGGNQAGAGKNSRNTGEQTKELAKGESGHVPEVPCFFPDDLLVWSAAEDADLAYTQSVIPLAGRIEDGSLPVLHEGKQEAGRVLAISIMNSSTSGNPAQGSGEFMGKANMFSYWQYIDTLVYWGGSSGEGIIVPPGPDVTDAAHKNGIPVLGCVFFPQEAHGGQLRWLKQMLARDAQGGFPAADKLIELAEALRFDGWFINQETEGGGPEDAAAMREMIQYMKKRAPELTVVWYDSMTEDGAIDWQNTLNDENRMFLLDDGGKEAADAMFLNFWWTGDRYAGKRLLEQGSRFADGLGLDPYQLYAGVDVQAEGTDTPIRWDLFFDEKGRPRTSLGLYCPSWAYYSAEGDVQSFHQREAGLWVNQAGDPSIRAEVDGTQWHGISGFKKEQSVLMETPFTTDFSIGHGLRYYAVGREVSGDAWNNRSLQGIMPTYRYVVEGEISGPSVQVDYEDAWNGGNCLKLTGEMKSGGTAKLKLFASSLPAKEGLRAAVISKSDALRPSALQITFTDGSSRKIPAGEQTFPGGQTTPGVQSTSAGQSTPGVQSTSAGQTTPGVQSTSAGQTTPGVQTTSAGQTTPAVHTASTGQPAKDISAGAWVRTEYDLSSCAGKTIRQLDLLVTADEQGRAELKLGQFTLYAEPAAGTDHTAVTAAQPSVEGMSSPDGIYADVRVRLGERQKGVSRYEIYRRQDGDYRLVKASVNPSTYLTSIRREGKESSATFAVTAVDALGNRSQAGSFTIEWGPYPKPQAEFSSDNTLVMPGESVHLKNLSSDTAESYEWSFPGARTESSQEREPAVAYDEEGVYSIALTAINSSGESSVEKKGLIVVDSRASKLEEAAAGKAVEVSGFTNEKEAGEFAVDGDTSTKWCAVGEGPHQITIDLGGEYLIGSVEISHAQAGGEGSDYNTRGFTISAGNDAAGLEEVAKVTDNREAVSTTPVRPVMARYVKVTVDQATAGSDTAARIYEIRVFGIPGK